MTPSHRWSSCPTFPRRNTPVLYLSFTPITIDTVMQIKPNSCCVRTKPPEQHNPAPPCPPYSSWLATPQTFLLSNTTDSNFTLWLLLVFLPEARRLGRMCRSLFKKRGEKHVKRHILKQNKAAEIYKPIITR